MRFTTLLVLGITLFGLSGCGGEDFNAKRLEANVSQAEKSGLQRGQNDAVPKQEQAKSTEVNVSLNQADSANAASQALERKIIRDGNLTIEVSSPADSQRKIFSVAESHGGFVVHSE